MVPRDDKYWSLQNLKIVVSFLFIVVFESPLKYANKNEKKNTTTTTKQTNASTKTCISEDT